MQTIISTGVLEIGFNRATVTDKENGLHWECVYQVQENGAIQLYHFRGWGFTEAEEQEFVEALHGLIHEQASDDAQRALNLTLDAIHALVAVGKHWHTEQVKRAMWTLEEGVEALAGMQRSLCKSASMQSQP